MSNMNDQDRKKLSLSSGRGTLSLGKSAKETAQVKQSFSHGRSKTVQVEVKRRRAAPNAGGPGGAGAERGVRELTAEERAARERALKHGLKQAETAAKAEAASEAAEAAKAEAAAEAVKEEVAAAPEAAPVEAAAPVKAAAPAEEAPVSAAPAETASDAPEAPAEEEKSPPVELNRRQAEAEEARRIAEEEAAREAENTARAAEELASRQAKAAAERAHARLERQPSALIPAAAGAPSPRAVDAEEDERRQRKEQQRRPSRTRGAGDSRRRQGKLTVSNALDDGGERMRSLASVRRQRERERLRQLNASSEQVKQSRDVTIPETITVQELSNRMAERAGDVVKALMKMGMMVTITQSIDADTAELIVEEFGHKARRVAESDVELGLKGSDDEDTDLEARPPVVTIMGHVDHGKTSLLDAIRNADVAAGEAGGITQHIGAYQIALPSGDRMTFLDTPGHEAFTEMRARGANVTDIVVLVVAADDGIMTQTIEAIRHAKAAEVPIIVAVNKIDKPEADPTRVRTELLQHELVVEDMGGDIQAIDVSAHTRQGLDNLLEAISLQAELMELKANPGRAAEGVVVEAKVEKGRGSVATILVQRGTLRNGDIFVAGAEWGRARALIDDHGKQTKEAGPSLPVEVLGLQGTPVAGDEFVVVENEARAREIVDYRQRMMRDKAATAGARGTVEQMLTAIQAGEAQELAIVVKTDVHGSLEAIRTSIERMETALVRPRILHGAVGGISESDVTLAKASNGLIVGFNVRANPQARDLARRENLEIRYYSIIYDLIDEVKALLSGMLSPEIKEEFIGYAEIREVFNITKVGKVAGCMVTEGVIKRGCKVRLLRDNVVVHEGSLKTLKRFKDEVRDVREGFECGMAFENYDDIRQGDLIECFELTEVARTLDQVQKEASAKG